MVGPSGKWIRLLSISNVSFPTRFLIWIGSDQEKTFGPTITGLIYNNIPPERMILWDSRKRGGRPDSVKLLKEVWDSFGAEVIFITSNRQGNDEMMQGCREGTWQHQEPWRAPSLFCDYDTVADTLSSGDACVWHAVGFLKPARRLAFTPSSALMFYIAYHAGYVFFDGITLHITHRMGSRHLVLVDLFSFSIRYSQTVKRSMGHVQGWQTSHRRVAGLASRGSSGALFVDSTLITTKKDASGFQDHF